MASPTLEEIERLIAAKADAVQKSEFAESLRCTVSALEGDRYKIVFSEASTEGDM